MTPCPCMGSGLLRTMDEDTGRYRFSRCPEHEGRFGEMALATSEQAQKALADAFATGTGVMFDGFHVPLNDFWDWDDGGDRIDLPYFFDPDVRYDGGGPVVAAIRFGRRGLAHREAK